MASNRAITGWNQRKKKCSDKGTFSFLEFKAKYLYHKGLSHLWASKFCLTNSDALHKLQYLVVIIKESNIMIAKALYTLIDSYPDLEGSKLLRMLEQHPNRPIFSTVLELVLSTDLGVDEAEASIYHPSAIPMVDYKTLREIDRRLFSLIEKKTHYLGTCGGDSSPFDVEIKALTKYRRDCTKPNGSPKSFPDEDRKAYRRQAAAIRRLFAKAEKEGHHEAVSIVKRSLKLGRMSMLKV